jgi:hypothetical protein
VWSELTAVVPAHCGGLVVNLAQLLAESWLEFAQELDRRSRADPDDIVVGDSVAEGAHRR